MVLCYPEMLVDNVSNDRTNSQNHYMGADSHKRILPIPKGLIWCRTQTMHSRCRDAETHMNSITTLNVKKRLENDECTMCNDDIRVFVLKNAII